MTKAYECGVCGATVTYPEDQKCPECKTRIPWESVIIDMDKWRKEAQEQRRMFYEELQKKKKGIVKDYQELQDRLQILENELRQYIETGKFPVEEGEESTVGPIQNLGWQKQNVMDPTSAMLGKGNILMLSELSCDIAPNAIELVEELEFAVTYELKNYESSLKMLLEAMASVGRQSRQEAKEILSGGPRLTPDTMMDQLAERMSEPRR